MTAPHDRPTAVELVEAVREFIERDVMPGTEGRIAFHARVAANVLAMVERELRAGGVHEREHLERLGALGFADDAELAEAIRRGDFDGRHDDLVRALEATTRTKLSVANPGYMGTAEP